MNSKKSNAMKNNENLCPRKRLKSSVNIETVQLMWKSASENSSKQSYTEEMGIGMLESEEKSATANSAIMLTVKTGTDENSNEATPNLDAPKMTFIHQRVPYRRADHSLNNSNDNANLSGFLLTNDLNKTISPHKKLNSSCDQSTEEGQKQIHRKSCEKAHKSNILEYSANANSSTNATSNANNLNANSQTNRSPLATVSNNRNSTNTQQLLEKAHNQNFSVSIATVPGSIYAHTLSQPSTSQQAVIIKQQMLLKKQQKQTQIEKIQMEQPLVVPTDNFFLYRNQPYPIYNNDGKDHFSTFPDEIILQILKWLPKKALVRCSYVCRNLNRCANDESLWTRLDLGARSLRPGAIGHVFKRGVVILRLAQAVINHPAIDEEFILKYPNFFSRLQYLDLSMVSITKPSLKMLLSHCRQLKKLSLEHVPLNTEICYQIAKNANIEALNLTMCCGLEAWSISHMMQSLQNLSSLNIAWTNLSVESITKLVTHLTPNLMRLNIAGCRKTMFDIHLITLSKRCPQLLELDLSDCTGLTGNAISVLSNFQMLEYLSLSRCYLIPASAFIDLSNLKSLMYLDVFGMLTDTALELLEKHFPHLGINRFMHSSVARPTVGTRRTSIWGLRTRD